MRGLLALLPWFVLSAVFREPGLHWSKNNQPTQRLCLDLPSCSHTFLLQATCVSCSTLGRRYSLFFQGMCLHKHLALTNELFIPRLGINCRLHCSAALFGRPKVPLVSPVPLCHGWDPGENSPIPGTGSLQAQLNKASVVLSPSQATDPLVITPLLLPAAAEWHKSHVFDKSNDHFSPRRSGVIWFAFYLTNKEITKILNEKTFQQRIEWQWLFNNCQNYSLLG